MMEQWKSELTDIALALIGKPETVPNAVVAGLVGVIVFLVVLSVVGKIVEARRTGVFVAICSLLVALVIILPAAVAARIYIVPHVSNTSIHMWVEIGAAVLAGLVVVLPLLCLLLKTNYVKALIIVLLSIVAAGALVALTNVIYGSISKGGGQFKNIKSRKNRMENTF